MQSRQEKILWIADGIQMNDLGQGVSSLASNRYRVLMPVKGLQDLGCQITMLPFDDWIGMSMERLEEHKVVIIGKLLPPRGQAISEAFYSLILDRIQTMKAMGLKVLADFCDDHFDRDSDGFYWSGLASAVDVCVAGSEIMAQRIKAVSSKCVCVAGDPVASPFKTGRIYKKNADAGGLGWLSFFGKKKTPLQMAWYGHPSNWFAVKAWVEQLAQSKSLPKITLWVVTNPFAELVNYIQHFNARHAESIRIELVAWNEQQQWEVVSDAHVVILPARLSDPRKSVKTANRLIDGLNAGCYVMASPVPSYQDYSKYVYLGDDPVGALLEYLSKPNEILDRIEQGQNFVKKVASTEVVAQQWLFAIDKAAY